MNTALNQLTKSLSSWCFKKASKQVENSSIESGFVHLWHKVFCRFFENFQQGIALRMVKRHFLVLNIYKLKQFCWHLVDKFFISIIVNLCWYSKFAEPIFKKVLATISAYMFCMEVTTTYFLNASVMYKMWVFFLLAPSVSPKRSALLSDIQLIRNCVHQYLKVIIWREVGTSEFEIGLLGCIMACKNSVNGLTNCFFYYSILVTTKLSWGIENPPICRRKLLLSVMKDISFCLNWNHFLDVRYWKIACKSKPWTCQSGILGWIIKSSKHSILRLNIELWLSG